MAEAETPDISPPQYVLRARGSTAADFDSKNADAVEEFFRNIGKVLALRLLVIKDGFDSDKRARYDAYGILASSFDILISAFHMARHRASVECLALSRVMIESTATALHIFNDHRAHDAFMSGTYKSTAAISFAKQHLAMLGELYGAQSVTAVHVGYPGFGPQIASTSEGRVKQSINMYYGVRPPRSMIQDRMLLTLLNLLSMIHLKALESILMEDDDTWSGWLKLSGTNRVYLHATDRLIRKYYDTFLELGAAVQYPAGTEESE